LDSTLGFVALTPVLVIILPAALWSLRQVRGRPQVALALYAGAVGILFALATAPGPLLHTVVAGAGTPLAEAATDLFGHDAAVAGQSLHAASHSPLGSALVQVGVGLPVYVALSWIAVRIALATGGSRSGQAKVESPKKALASTA
jgi:hypothetical protein